MDVGLLSAKGEEKEIGMTGSVLNFLTIILGGGLLGWPSVFKQGGMFGGVLISCLLCFLSERTLTLIVDIGIWSRSESYEVTCYNVWGMPGYYLIALSCFMIDFGVLVSYWVMLGDLLQPVILDLSHIGGSISHLSAGVSTTAVKLVFAVILFPFCLSPSMAGLAKWSMFNLLLMLVCGAVLILAICLKQTPEGGVLHQEPQLINPGFWPAMGTMAFTYVNHDSAFSIYHTLSRGNSDEATRNRWAIVCHVSMWSTVILTLIFGLPVYCRLGDATQSDVMNNVSDDWVMSLTRSILAVNVSITMVYLQQVGRRFLRSLLMPLWWFCQHGFGERFWQLVHSQADYHQLTQAELWTFTLLQWGVAALLGAFVGDLGPPMQLTGVLAQAMAAFVIPPLLLFSLRWKDPSSLAHYGKASIMLFTCVLIFGLLSCSYGVVNVLSSHA